MDDAQITTINRDYLDRDRPTNVIAFPMREGPFGNITPGLLGDVVISLQTTATEALNAGLSMETRFSQLLVHGILHLFNYDHETCREDAAIMEAKSKEVLQFIAKHCESKPPFINKPMDPNPAGTSPTTATPDP